MMNERQWAKELEQLSAFLDGQLNETEKKQIETRLTREPELQEAYEGLRKTKLLFSRIPRVRAPRSFALTPEMVKVRKAKRPFYTSLRWATSLAAVLLAVVFGAEVFLNNPMLANRAAPAEQVYLESMAVEDEAAMAEDSASTKAIAPEPLIIWGAPGQSGGGGTGMGIGGGGDIAEETAPLEVEPDTESLPPENTENQTPDIPTQVRIPADGSSDGETPILGINSDEAGEIISTSEEAIPDEASSKWLTSLSPLRWAEISLALIVVVGAILLLIKRKP